MVTFKYNTKGFSIQEMDNEKIVLIIVTKCMDDIFSLNAVFLHGKLSTIRGCKYSDNREHVLDEAVARTLVLPYKELIQGFDEQVKRVLLNEFFKPE